MVKPALQYCLHAESDRVCFRLLIIWLAVSATSFCYGTLIITVPNQQGLLIASDRLVHNSESGYVAEVQKVVRLATNAALAITGTVGISLNDGSDTNHLGRDEMIAFELAKAYFTTNSLKPFDVFQFANCMNREYSKYLADYRISGNNLEFTACQFIFLRVDPSREVRTFTATLFPARSMKEMKFSIVCQQIIQKETDFATVEAYGHPEVPKEILHGTDQRFAEVRTNAIIARFLPHGPTIRKLTLPDAQLFARKLMAEASLKTQMLSPGILIGNNVDEMMLAFPGITSK